MIRKKFFTVLLISIFTFTITLGNFQFCFAGEENIENLNSATETAINNEKIAETSANTTANETSSDNEKTAKTSANTTSSSENASEINETGLKSGNFCEKNNPLNLTCGGAILIEQNSGEVLYDYNMHEKLRPASVTKVMSLLLVMEALDSGKISLKDKVPCTEDAAKMGGSQIWLDTKEELTVDEMLKAITIVSANDCVVALADYLAGSQEAFVEMMNKKAKELGMNDTTFKNCHGIDEDGHLTSPYDIAIMSRELLTKHPTIKNYTTIYMDSLRDGKSQLVNTNKLVRNYEGCTGLKTGSTSLALFNLSASATRNNLSLIAVIMRGETSKIRFSEASKLLNYGFANYEYKELAKKGESVGTCVINKGIKREVNAVYENDFGCVMKKSNSTEIETNIEIFKNVYAPIKKGDVIGEVTFTNNGSEIGKVNLISDEDDAKYGLKTMTKSIYKDWFTLLRN